MTDGNTKSRQIGIRLTESEYEKFRSAVSLHDVGVSEYARMMLFDGIKRAEKSEKFRESEMTSIKEDLAIIRKLALINSGSVYLDRTEGQEIEEQKKTLYKDSNQAVFLGKYLQYLIESGYVKF